MKRHLARMEHRILEQLEECKKVRKVHRDARKRKNLPTVGIIGYTNVGKTSLLNALTRKGAYAAHKLFATLDTRVGKMYFPESRKEVLVSDTIGFIQDLPTTLIKSFQSTLEETIEADLLLHVMDVSDPRMAEKIKIVNVILAQIDALHKPTLFVLNKIDCIGKRELVSLRKKVSRDFNGRNPLCVSSVSGEGLEELKKGIQKGLHLD
jgi:GTP-binding protein HflX